MLFNTNAGSILTSHMGVAIYLSSMGEKALPRWITSQQLRVAEICLMAENQLQQDNPEAYVFAEQRGDSVYEFLLDHGLRVELEPSGLPHIFALTALDKNNYRPLVFPLQRDDVGHAAVHPLFQSMAACMAYTPMMACNALICAAQHAVHPPLEGMGS